MADIANLNIRIDSTQTRQASTELDRMSQAGQRAEQQMSGMSAMAMKLAAALTAAFSVYKVVEFGKAITLSYARFQTLGIVMNTVGKNAGYSAQNMATFEQQLRKSGIAMTEARTTLTRMTQAQIDLNKASQLARLAQDAAVIGNINSSEAFERMIHGIQSAQVEILRGIGLNVNFENAYKKMANQIGVTSAELTEYQKTQARVNVVMEAGSKITGVYEAAMDTAGKKFSSLQRHIDDFLVVAGKMTDQPFGIVIDAITDILKGMKAWVEANQELLKMGLHETFSKIVDILTILAAVLAGRLLAALVRTGAAVTLQTRQWILYQSALARQAGISRAAAASQLSLGAAVRVGNKALALVGGPVGAATIAVMALIRFREELGLVPPSAEAATNSIADLTTGLHDLTEAQSEHRRFQLIDQLDEQVANLKRINTEIERIKNVSGKSGMLYGQAGYAQKKIASLQADADSFQQAIDKVNNALERIDNRSISKTPKSFKPSITPASPAKPIIPDEIPVWVINYEKEMKKIEGNLDKSLEAQIAKERETLEQYKKYRLSRPEIIKNANAKILALQKEQQEKLTNLEQQTYEKMHQDLGTGSSGWYARELEFLDKKKEKYAEITADKVILDNWYNNEYQKLLDKQTKMQEAAAEKKLMAEGSFFDGLKWGYKKSENDLYTWARAGVDAANRMTNDMSNAFSDTLFRGIKGDLEGISEVWEGFMDSMLRTLTDTVSKMAVQWGIGSVGSLTGWWDTGAWEVKKDHVAMIHKGEMIVPADVATIVRNKSRSSDVSALARVSPAGGHEWDAEIPALASSFMKGTGKSYTMHALQGLSLAATNKISVDSLMSGLVNPQALIGAALTGGVQQVITDKLGLHGKWTKGGGVLGGMLGSIISPYASGLTGGLGSYIGDKIGDWVNLREMEGLRDYLENKGVKYTPGDLSPDSQFYVENYGVFGPGGYFNPLPNKQALQFGSPGDYSFGDDSGRDFGSSGGGLSFGSVGDYSFGSGFGSSGGGLSFGSTNDYGFGGGSDFGFATGGSFRVAGNTGRDALSLPNMRVTAGEMVNVSKHDSMSDLAQEMEALRKEFRTLREENRTHAIANIKACQAIERNTDYLEVWDTIGVPQEREV